MRTLKKTLALVLVLAMMLSFAVTANADFTDADEITFVEAVDVLTGLGVIEGMPDGSFDAAGTLTRAQATKIIVYMLGAEDYAIATEGEFDDVAADHWAAGYITFCVDAGIVDGYGDGNFGPSDKLTGYQWAKMLLCALGYNAEAEGMTGSAWQIKVAQLATKLGLFAGNAKADKTAPVTREAACLYAFNTLPARTVSYSGGSSVTVGDITFTSGGILNDTTGASFMAKYQPALQKNELDAEDNYGFAGTEWWINGDDDMTAGWNSAFDTYIGCYNDEEITASYPAGTKYIDVIKAMGVKNSSATYDVEIYNNGVLNEDETEALTGVAGATLHTTYADAVIPAGVTVDVVVTSDGTIRLLLNIYYLGVITASDDVEDDTKDDVDDRSVTITKWVGGAATDPATTYELKANNTADFEAIFAAANALTGDDKLYYVIQPYGDTSAKDAELLTLNEAESFEGKLTKKTTAGVYTIGGADYQLNVTATGLTINNYTESYTYYLDNNGFILYTTAPAAAEANYAFLEEFEVYTKTAASLDDEATTYMQAKLVMPDGTTKVVDVASVKVVNETYTATAGTSTKAITAATTADNDGATTNEELVQDLAYSVFTYTVTEDGEYKLTAATTVTAASGTISAKPAFAGNLTAYNNTTFIVRTGAGSSSDPYAYKAYTGYANLPVSATVSLTAAVYGNTTGNIFYLVGTTAAAQGTEEYAYITSVDYTEEYVSSSVTTYTFNAIVDGEETTIVTKNANIVAAIAGNEGTGVGMYKVKYTAGYLTAASKENSDTVTTKAKDGVIAIETAAKAYNDSTVVYFIEDGKVAAGAITDIPADKEVYVQYVKDTAGADTDTIAIIYYDKDQTV